MKCWACAAAIALQAERERERHDFKYLRKWELMKENGQFTRRDTHWSTDHLYGKPLIVVSIKCLL